jgi:hypothetical protein
MPCLFVRLLFKVCVTPSSGRQNAPDGLVRHPVVFRHLPQGFSLSHPLHHARPLRARYLEGRRGRIHVRVFGWYTFHDIYKERR